MAILSINSSKRDVCCAAAPSFGFKRCPPMNEAENIAKAKRIAAGALGEKLAKFPLLFAKAAFFGQRPSKNRPSEISNGTVSLVDLGDGPLAVTCEHVIAGFTKMANAHNNLVFQIGSVEINLLEQLIDRNARLDLATIRLTEEQATSITSEGEIGSCVFRPKAWPPEENLKKGDFVAFGGFPGSLRTVASFDEYIFESWSSGASQISSVSDGQFVSAFESEFRVKSFGAERNMNIDALGGMSGGPVFIDRGLFWDFVGIVSQYHENYDAMFFASVSGLRPNGTITPLPV